MTARSEGSQFDIRSSQRRSAGSARGSTLSRTPGAASLSPEALADLRRSGLSDETIALAGFEPSERGGWYLTYPGTDAFYRERVLHPQEDEGKYRSPAGAGLRLYIPPNLPEYVLSQVHFELWITEGEKKALASCQAGLWAIGIAGIDAWSSGDGEELPGFGLINWKGRSVVLCYDSDITEAHVGYPAFVKLAERLRARGAEPRIFTLPPLLGLTKAGLDDHLIARTTVEQLRRMSEDLVDPDELLLRKLGFDGARWNVPKQRIEIRGVPVDSGDLALLRNRARRAKESAPKAEDALEVVAHRHLVNPILDVLRECADDYRKRADGRDYIYELATHLVPGAGAPGDTAKTWQTIRRWTIGAARRMATGLQNPVLAIPGPQGIGKSRFAAWLGEPFGREYTYSGPIFPDLNDCLRRLLDTAVWEISELGSTTRRADRESLKYFLSLEHARLRVPYGRADIEGPAVSAFIATVNLDGAGFLSDPTGHRRFCVVPLERIRWEYTDRCEARMVWGQAFAEWQANPSAADFTFAEREHLAEQAERHEIADPIEELVVEKLTFTGKADDFLTSVDIATRLGLDARSWTKAVQMSAATALTRHGAKPARCFMHGKQQRGWRGVRA